MLDEIESKTMHSNKVINRGKSSKTLNEVKPFKNVYESADFSRNKSFLHINCETMYEY